MDSSIYRLNLSTDLRRVTLEVNIVPVPAERREPRQALALALALNEQV